MKRKYYTVECENCMLEYAVVTENSDEEPQYCTFCGHEAYAILEDEDE